LNIRVSREFLDKCNVRAVQKQIRAIGVPEHMRRQMFFNPCLDTETPKNFGNIVWLQTPGETRGNKKGLAIILPAVGMDEFVNPLQA
jgi:hypothetical protein